MRLETQCDIDQASWQLLNFLPATDALTTNAAYGKTQNTKHRNPSFVLGCRARLIRTATALLRTQYHKLGGILGALQVWTMKL
jgi:hypothetical protein